MLGPRKSVNLTRRGNTWHTRVYVPKDVVHLVGGKKEITKSLMTSDKLGARLAAEKFRNEQYSIFEQLLEEEARPVRKTSSLTDDELLDLARAVYQEFRQDSEAEIAAFLKMPSQQQNQLRLEPNEREEVLKELLDFFGLADGSRDWAKKILRENKIDLPEETQGFTKLVGLVRQAIHQAILVYVNAAADTPGKDESSIFVDHETGFARPRKIDTISGGRSGVYSLEALSEAFMVEVTATRGRKGVAKVKFTLDVMRDFFGNRHDIRLISRKEIISFRNLLHEMPANASKHYPGLRAQDAAKTRRPEHPERSISSVNTDLRNIKQFFSWLAREDEDFRSPNLDRIFLNDPVEEIDKRPPFSEEQLVQLFSSAQMRGAADADSLFFWAFVISLFTGLRANEIASLAPEDIIDIGGITGIDLKTPRELVDGVRRGRSKTIPRLVPLPLILQNIGLEKLVRCREGNRLLFKEATKSIDGYFSEPITDWTSKTCKALGFGHSGVSFHSLRHNAKNAMEDAGLTEMQIAYIGGWKQQGVMFKFYGSKRYPDGIEDAINKVSYKSLDKQLVALKSNRRF